LAYVNNWRYDIYEENTISGENLDTRPVLLNLLKLIEDTPDLYDAILVMDYDRLSRGDSTDFSKIKRLLIYANVQLATTEGIYDLSKSGDSMLLGVKSVVASSELTQIKKRFREGKLASAKKGRFCNGDVPFPYKKKYTYFDCNCNKIERYEDETESEYQARVFHMIEVKQARLDFEVVVDEKQRPIYDYIKDSFLYKRMSMTQICNYLNTQHIPTKYSYKYPNALWQVTTIRDILINKVHLGYYCYNKHSYKYKPLQNKTVVVNNPETDWIIGKGKHEALLII
jgi:DNA invertase Pin-like site-specific DNA recombinase